MRSSSYNTYSMCPSQFWHQYVLGIKPETQPGWVLPKSLFKAAKGTATHKCLELLACKKLALQEGQPTFSNGELGRTWDTVAFTIDDAIEASWRFYTIEQSTPWTWTDADYRDIRKWVFAGLECSNGLFNPLNRTVLWPEKYFDLTIIEPWAKYNYVLPDGERLEGYLGLKGTIDLCVDAGGGTVELIDWKTSGSRMNWATGEIKEWKDLRYDSQLSLYYYALTKLFPEIDHLFITIVFLQAGGPYSLDFSRQDIPRIESMIRKRFEEVRDTSRPTRIMSNPTKRWQCKKLCGSGMNTWPGTKQTACDFLNGELIKLGIDRATAKYGKPGAFSSYGDGGGRTAKKEEDVGKSPGV